MKIISWNINGIRANRKTSVKDMLTSLSGDVVCLQETKVTRDMLDENSAIIEGYNSYFSFSRKRSGYSGTANICGDSMTPMKAEEGLTGRLTSDEAQTIGKCRIPSEFSEEEIKELDAEGRTVITQHRIRLPDGEERDLAIINVYCPRFDPDRRDRFEYKMRFHALLQARAEAILETGSFVIILGDLNTTHQGLDRCEEDDGESNKLPGRLWLDQMLWETGRDSSLQSASDEDYTDFTISCTTGGKFVDTYRHLYPTKEGAYSNWCTLTNARSTNYGRRLDYILADVNLTQQCLKSAFILQDFEGSDHCPVGIDLDCVPVAAKTCPPLCTKFMPEFSGKQMKLSNFFTKKTKKDSPKKECDTEHSHLNQHSVETKALVTGVKRTNSELLEEPIDMNLKKQKTAESSKSVVNGKTIANSKLTSASKQSNKSGAIGKQSSLISFFKGAGNKSVKADLVKSDTGTVSKYFNVIKEENQNNTSEELHSQELIEKHNKQAKDDNSPEAVLEETNDKPNLYKANSQEAAKTWKSLLGGLGPAPLCKGHNEPCVLRMVKKPGPNKGKQFYVCNRGQGLKTNPEARCDFFKWVQK